MKMLRVMLWTRKMKVLLVRAMFPLVMSMMKKMSKKKMMKTEEREKKRERKNRVGQSRSLS